MNRFVEIKLNNREAEKRFLDPQMSILKNANFLNVV